MTRIEQLPDGTEVRRVEVLFIGVGASASAWYRIVLPAMYLGCDWMGVAGAPPKLRFVTGYVKQATQMARFEDYDVVVVQQPRGKPWFRLIGELQSRGIKVLYEVDDYVHGIRKADDHDFREFFDREALHNMELCMRRADGLICSTDYLSRRYRQFNKRTWVCPNGLDMARYRLGRPTPPTLGDRPAFTIMWAGGTGHMRGLGPWLELVDAVMHRHEHVRFCSIGYPFAEPFGAVYGPRAISIPFASLESYPSAMTIGDVALAPAGSSSFYRAKSPLRAMEAGALGIPVVAAPHYSDVVLDGDTGFIADSPAAAEEAIERLIQDDSLRLEMGERARRRVSQLWDMRQVVDHWKTALTEALDASDQPGGH